MADETTIIRQIYLHPIHSTVDDVIRLLRDLTPAKKIHLVLHFTNSDRSSFSDTVLRELVLEKKSQIHHLEVHGSFEFLVQFLLANNGETKHFRYSNYSIPMQLDQATKLSNAIRSNNNNGNIESFIFSGWYDSSEVFQPVWDALLATGVQDIKLYLEFSENNNVNGGGNKIDVSNISTNTSLKELQVDINLCGTNLFDSIKGNTTVEKLILHEANLDNKGKRAFNEMLLENTTLIHVELLGSNFNHMLREEINVHTTVNQIWKRLIIVKRKERIAAAATAAISTTAAAVAITAVDDATIERRKEQDNNVDEVEKKKKMAEEKKMMKKKKEMNLWLKSFEKKPVLCNELIYLFLTEHAGDRYVYNTNNGTSSIERKRKR